MKPTAILIASVRRFCWCMAGPSLPFPGAIKSTRLPMQDSASSAFDLKGFGRSDAPKDASLYDVAHIADDISALLDHFEVDKAIFCGHDWGGAIVWSMGQLRPTRVAGVIGVCTPLRPRSPAPPITIVKNRFGDKHYYVQFQTPKCARSAI